MASSCPSRGAGGGGSRLATVMSTTSIDLRARRLALGLSQERVAARAGMHVRNYGLLERRWPHCRLCPEQARRLGAALEVEPADLLAAAQPGTAAVEPSR